jgi:hypothetical protein
MRAAFRRGKLLDRRGLIMPAEIIILPRLGEGLKRDETEKKNKKKQNKKYEKP